ncbi:MAG: GWxTD domain-containing protein [Bacteroidota bacterium]|nr:GWxTD domain-containing protein [Bacteroidota bacterium]
MQSAKDSVESTELSRLDVYVQIPFNHLRFEKDFNNFKASYGLQFVVRNEQREIVQTKEIDRQIEARSYEESVSSRLDFALQTFMLPPGMYTLEIISTDNTSQLKYRFTEKFTAKDFSKPNFSTSSELLLDTITTGAKGISLRPILPASLSLLNTSFGIFQELYHVHAGDTVTIAMSFTISKPTEPQGAKFSYLMPPYRRVNQRCAQDGDSVYYRQDSTYIVQRDGMLQLFQFYPLPLLGSTFVKRTITTSHDTIIATRKLWRRDKNYLTMPTPEEITAALRYIMREEEYDSLAVLTGQNRLQYIKNFWELHGGTQRQLEFEKKVMEANALFTTCFTGSQTPMGITYIVCGSPDYVDCRGQYSENWYYNIGDRASVVQFRLVYPYIDVSNYELVPFSVSDILWQYFLDRWRRKK